MNRVGIKDKVRFEEASQVLTFEAPQGRPSADGTVTLYDPRYKRTDATKNPIVTGTAARLAVDAATSGAAGPAQNDPHNVPCTPPAALKVGMFILIEKDGLRERIEVQGIAASAIRSAYPLVWDYASGATLKSAVMTSPAVPTAWVSSKDNLAEDFEAVWSYTVDGQPYVDTTRWDLVREIPATAIFDSVILERWPELKQFRFKGQPSDYQPQVKAAQRDVDMIVLRRGYDPDKVKGNEGYKYLVEFRTMLLISRQGIKPNGRTLEAFIEENQKEWDDLRHAVLDGSMKLGPYDADDDGVVTKAERRVTHRRVIR